MIVMNIAATYTTLTATFWLTRPVISAQCGDDRFSSAPGCRCGWHEGRGQAGHLGSPARTSQTVGGTEGRPRRGVMCRARVRDAGRLVPLRRHLAAPAGRLP